jgi:N-acetylmuramoyl-L-alanine amidase
VRFLFVFCSALAMAVPAFAQAPPLHAHRLAGGSYITVGEISDYYQINCSQLVAEHDRREITLNGVQHWLSAPVLAARGQLWITSLDVLKTIDPVLRQGRSLTARPVRLVVLDPGHGGSDTGARGRQSREKTLTLDVAQRVERYLEAAGLNTVLTRTTDRTLSLDDRVAFATRQRADLFVSIHFNSGGSAEGIETYCVPPAGAVSTSNPFRRFFGHPDPPCANNRYDEKNVWLAHGVQRLAARATGASDRGVRRARFVVIRDAPCPAILVEGGFLSNRVEEQRIGTTEYREKLAKAIADGILDYRRCFATAQMPAVSSPRR